MTAATPPSNYLLLLEEPLPLFEDDAMLPLEASLPLDASLPDDDPSEPELEPDPACRKHTQATTIVV